jgi:hypothetical protein
VTTLVGVFTGVVLLCCGVGVGVGVCVGVGVGVGVGVLATGVVVRVAVTLTVVDIMREGCHQIGAANWCWRRKKKLKER